jgi:hypothetical protein
VVISLSCHRLPVLAAFGEAPVRHGMMNETKFLDLFPLR